MLCHVSGDSEKEATLAVLLSSSAAFEVKNHRLGSCLRGLDKHWQIQHADFASSRESSQLAAVHAWCMLEQLPSVKWLCELSVANIPELLP